MDSDMDARRRKYLNKHFSELTATVCIGGPELLARSPTARCVIILLLCVLMISITFRKLFKTVWRRSTPSCHEFGGCRNGLDGRGVQ